MTPQPGDLVVTKRSVGAFSTTDLETLFRAKKIKTVVLFGISTSGVVHSKVRWVVDINYSLFVISDPCADRDEEIHRALIEKIFPRQSTVITTAEHSKTINSNDGN